MFWFKLLKLSDDRQRDTPEQISLREITDATSFLKGLNYSVSGGSAMMHYINDRATHDIDILIAKQDLMEAKLRYQNARQKIIIT